MREIGEVVIGVWVLILITIPVLVAIGWFIRAAGEWYRNLSGRQDDRYEAEIEEAPTYITRSGVLYKKVWDVVRSKKGQKLIDEHAKLSHAGAAKEMMEGEDG